uniref:C2H2-type domain-containing protein n=1 Tax=Leptobrachium leishanense TaxID=445787 RepID=A0A8C5N573_9ANUR
MSVEKLKYVRSQKLLLKQNVVFIAESESRLQEERVQYQRPAQPPESDPAKSRIGGISSCGAAQGSLQRMRSRDPRLQSRAVVRLERVKISDWSPDPPPDARDGKPGRIIRLPIRLGGEEDACGAARAGYCLIPFGSDRRKTNPRKAEIKPDHRRTETAKSTRRPEARNCAEPGRRDTGLTLESPHTMKRTHEPGRTRHRALNPSPVSRRAPTLLECPECGKKFVFSYNLKCHMRSHTENTRDASSVTENTQGRPQDGKSYLRTQLKARRAKHGKIPKRHRTVRPFVCATCERRFHSGVSLSAHQHVHTGRRCVCPSCGKRFCYRAILLAHQWLHSGRKPFRCPRCTKRFLQRSHLQRHQKVLLHQSLHLGARGNTCARCGKFFRMKVHLKSHQAAHAGMASFECTECGRRFGQRRRLVWHQLIHTGERPYVCTQCGQSFRWKRNLNAHLQVHSIESFPCDECGRSFTHQALLRLHQLMHTTEKPYVCTKPGSKRGRRRRDAVYSYTKWEKTFRLVREIHSHETSPSSCSDGDSSDRFGLRAPVSGCSSCVHQLEPLARQIFLHLLEGLQQRAV